MSVSLNFWPMPQHHVVALAVFKNDVESAIDRTAYTNITEYVLKPWHIANNTQTEMKICCTFPACLYSNSSHGHIISENP